MQPPRQVAFAYGITVALVLGLVFAFHFRADTGLTSLIRFGGLRADKLPPELAGVPVFLVPNHHGYDGQYYAHLALHPPWIYHDLASHYDFPSYRARRIFMPALAYTLGWGRPAWIVHIFSLLNLASWLALAALLTHWLPPSNWPQFGRWAGCLLAAGTLESIRGSLADLPALVIALTAARLHEAGRLNSSAALFAASILSRETMALSALGIFWPRELRRGPLLRSGCLSLAAIAPLVAWAIYVATFFRDSDGSRHNFGLPFAAMLHGAADALAHVVHGGSDNGRYVFRLLTIFSMAVQIGVALAGWRRRALWLRFSLGFTVLYPLLGSAVWEGPWAIWRTELPVTIAFCLLTPVGRWFWPVLIAGSLPSALALFRLAF